VPTAPTTLSAPAADRRLLFAEEIAPKLGYATADSVLRLVRRDGLPARRAGRRYLFDPNEVDAWLRARGAEPSTATDHRAAIKRLVDTAPELTAEQAERIRAVLTGGVA
jgi:excisionase family DNA binding protein